MSKPKQNAYLKDAILDRLARMNLELLSELWITRDRLASLEAVLEKREHIQVGEVDKFSPDEDLASKLEILREIMVQNVVGSADMSDYSVQSLIELGQRLRTIHN